jgi:hypothetical protein
MCKIAQYGRSALHPVELETQSVIKVPCRFESRSFHDPSSAQVNKLPVYLLSNSPRQGL